MKSLIWSLRGLGRLAPVRSLTKAFFRNVLYRPGRTITIRSGPLKGMKWLCMDGEQFYMPMGVYEAETSRWLSEAIRPGDTFFDIGANAGYFTLLGARRVGETGKVVSFEPLPGYHAGIAEKIHINDLRNVLLNRSVVGPEDREAVDFVEEENGANSHIASIDVTHCSSNSRRTIPTPMVCLDSYCSRHGLKPSVIKIDVEGAEAIVLRGMTDILARHRPRLIVSIHSASLSRECRAMLEAAGCPFGKRAGRGGGS